MAFKLFKRVFLGVIFFVLALGFAFLFSSRNKEVISFPNSKSKLEIREVNLLEKILTQNKSDLGKLIITSEPEKVNVFLRRAVSISPLVFDSGFSLSFDTPKELKLKSGKYWLSASKSGYSYFSTNFEIKPLKEYRLHIVLKFLKVEQVEGGPTDIGTENEFKQAMEDYYRKFPLAKFLPYRTQHFKIFLPTEEGVYRVELYPTANSLLENELYKKQIADYKKEVYEWIKSKGYDPDKLVLKFWPE